MSFDKVRISRTLFVAAVGGSLLSMGQAAEASHGQHQFREFRQQNPDIDRHTARRMFQQNRHDNSLQSAQSPGSIFTINQAADGIVRVDDSALGKHHHKINNIERIRNQTVQIANDRIVRLNTGGVDLDLTSQSRNITLGKNLFADGGSVDIVVDGQTKTVSAGSHVTAAEYVAVKQVVAGNAQTLTVSKSGVATGGQLDLGSLTADNDVMRASDLVVASNVTTYGDFGKRSDFRLLGDLTNYGTVHASSSDKGIHAGTIHADDITNHSGALISSTVDLTLDARGTISNDGDIVSLQGLTLTGGNSVHNRGAIVANNNVTVNSASVTNSGVVESLSGNIQLIGSPSAPLVVNNQSGILSAAHGAISLRDAAYIGTENSTITGGDLLSAQLNLYSGQGLATVSVNQLTGHLNEYGTGANVFAATDVLTIGDVCLNGDPTFYNSKGDIAIVSNLDITNGEALVIVAARDIQTSPSISISNNGATQGNNITLIAGADFTPTGAVNDSPSLPGGTPGGVLLSGKASKTGGSILFGSGVNITATSTAGILDEPGGNVSMFAFAKAAGTGLIEMSGVTINTSGFAKGANGSVLLVAGAKEGNAINVGTIKLNGAGGGGDVGIFAAQPISSEKKGSVEYNAAGLLVSTAQLMQSPTSTKGSILFNGAGGGTDVNVKGGNINARAGGAINLSGDIAATGAVSLDAGTDIVLNPAAADVVGGQVNMFAGNNIGTVANPIRVDTPFITANAQGDFANVFTVRSGLVTINDSAASDTLTVNAPFATLQSLNVITAPNLNFNMFNFSTFGIGPGKDSISITTQDPNFDVNGITFGGTKDLTISVAGQFGTIANRNIIADVTTAHLSAGKGMVVVQAGNKAIHFDLSGSNDVVVASDRSMIIDKAASVAGLFGAVINLKGSLTIAGDVTAKTGIQIVGSSTVSNKLVFNPGIKLETTAKTAGQGNILISVGPNQGIISAPPNFAIEEIGTGKVTFSGAGAKGSSPVNKLKAENANININNGFKVSNILFKGDVFVHADPPGLPGDVTVFTPATANSKPLAGTAGGSPAYASPTSLDISGTSETELTSASSLNLLSAPISLGGTSGVLSSSNFNLLSFGTGALNIAPDDSVITLAQPRSLQHDANLVTTNSGRASLSQGSTLYCPSVDLIVNTPVGEVSISAGSVVLVSVSDEKLSIYDFHDEHRGGVHGIIDGAKISLAPGQHMTIANPQARSFADINPIEAIPHRNVSRSTLASGKNVFASQFSLVNAIQVVKPVNVLLQAKHQEHKRISNKLMKTTAVVMHISGNERFEFHTAPRMVALK